MNLLKNSDEEGENPPEFNQVSDNNDQSESSISVSSSDIENSEKEETEPVVEILEDQDQVPKYMIRMLNLANEIAIFCVLMIAYTAFTNEAPKISKAPVAYPFFSKDSHVTDYYRGQISLAIEQARVKDVSFIMFYAPWDTRSQVARQEFEITAKYMQQYVSLTAVNCWQPNSECRIQYSKVYRWPILIVYPTFGRGIQYNGPLQAPHMIKFLQKIIRPIEKATKNIVDFEDGYVVADLNTLPGSYEYAVFYAAAQKYLEKDPSGKIRFYVRPVVNSSLILHLHLWSHERISNEFMASEWRMENILQWIHTNMEQVTDWVTPSGTKSTLLSTHIQPRPSLILFTPRNPLHMNIDYYFMLQEIAQEYKNCDSLILKFDIAARRLKNLLEHTYLEKTCSSKVQVSRPKIVSTISPKVWANVSGCHVNKETSLKKDCTLVLENRHFGSVSGDLKEYCMEVPQVRKLLTEYEDRFKIVEHYKTSMLDGTDDPKSVENLSKLYKREQCRQFLTAQKLFPAVFEDFDRDQKRDTPDITGLSCKTNRSLSFVAMDSLLDYHFAERLGVDVLESKDRSAAVIIDGHMETHYILNGAINSRTLRQFIFNFTKDQLVRSLNSSTSVESRNTHSYQTVVSNKNKSIIFVRELTSSNFLDAVLEDDKAVIVMYYSKQCSFCNGISYTFLTAARKLLFVKNIEFARIDGDLNLLPWEYTMETFPTIILFPPKSKSESRVFPVDLPITVPNLIGFILTNLDQKMRLNAMYSMCNQTQFEADKATCFSSLRSETLTVIDNTLKAWRKSNKRQKQIHLYNLKQLRQLHLLFGYSPDKHKLITSYFTKLNTHITKEYVDFENCNSATYNKDEL